jgi:S-DNA-T family DNA segregation ATPase FtsK/SpoIIIE
MKEQIKSIINVASWGGVSLWNPIPVGVDENGEVVTVTLPERNVLIGGEPGAGKSVALSMLVATAAMDPEVRLSLLDAKLVELAVWRDCAERFVGDDPNEAIGYLKELREEMGERYRYLLERRRRKITREDAAQFPLHLVVIDELALYTATVAKGPREEFSNLLRDLVSRGRAAGIIVVAATQKPSGDVVATALRDLFGFRWALRCSTPQASDTILGSGWATQGFSASSIDAADRGVGFLLHEGLIPVRLKAYCLSDDDLAAIAARALQLRGRRIA